jgi:hypothetical protein
MDVMDGTAQRQHSGTIDRRQGGGLTMSDPDQVRKFIYEELDLAPVRQQAKTDFGWSDVDAEQADGCYRNFLWVCWYAVDHGTTRLPAISVPADKMWHSHILLTRKYREDCHAIFGPGWVLDHYPAGVNGEPKVTAEDMRTAEAMYHSAGKELCLPIRSECVWAAGGNGG